MKKKPFLWELIVWPPRRTPKKPSAGDWAGRAPAADYDMQSLLFKIGRI
jgi:hypothetical protein